jgi:SAM-dependent methyltransferase
MTNFTTIDGIQCYAPELAKENDGFHAEGFDDLYRAESKSFWFRSRNNVIKTLVKKHINNNNSMQFLEIGCGNAFVLSGLSAEFPKYQMWGAEIYLEGLKYAQKRLPNAKFVQLDATKIPFESEFEAIGSFDVLEHIDQDELVMKNIHKALKPGGHFFISVPQYMWMWSIADDYACHKRRYSKKELRTKLETAGFEIEYIGSFVFALFPAMAISRILNKKQKNEDMKAQGMEIFIHPTINAIFTAFMKIDEILIKAGISLPFGGSLIAVAKRK